mmetsp:Transcript_16736/g.41213  ORF Transcript_16736/g.41213 Transcript_16736/m.41213 type:complete len:159 (+) Transcript_16736:443-919(+)
MQSCLDSRLQIFFPDLFSYAVIPADDIGSFNMLQYFDCATKYIHSLHKTGAERILIHCSVGRSRSVAIVLAYLIRYHGHTLNSAFLHVWSRRQVADPNVGFLSQLEIWEMTFRGRKSTLRRLPHWKKMPFRRQYPNPEIEKAAKAYGVGKRFPRCAMM